MKKVGIILINFKEYAKKYLVECRDSIRNQSYHNGDIRIYIVDNASTHESYAYLKNKYPEAKILKRPDGNYAAANNLGIRESIKDGCDYIVVANMDTYFHEDWLKELLTPLVADEIGIVQSKIMLYPTGGDLYKAKINSIGNIIHFLGFGFTDGYGRSNKEIVGYPEIHYASGCSLAMRREVFEIIGGYNEEFYMYHDDLEMSWKAKLSGLKVVLAPGSIVYHKYEFSRSVKMLYFMERNRMITVLSFYSLKTLLLVLPALIAMDFGMLLYSAINGWFLTKIKIYGYFINPKSWYKIYRYRKKIAKIRKLKDKHVVKNFVGRVLFQEVDNPVLKYVANPIFDKYWKIMRKLI